MNYSSITKESILDAAARIKPFIHRTQVMSSHLINEKCGAKIFFKCENMQKVGAFKARGAFNAALKLPEEKRNKGLATHSSGNHAQALALAAKSLGVPAYIVMPSNSPDVKKDAVRGYGAEITECEPNLRARETTLEEIVERTGATFVPPYNDLDIIEGQATCALELIQEVPELHSIIAPVGGGGLLSGTLLSASFFSESISVFAAEPKGADDAYQSLKQGKLVPSHNPNTISDGLLTSLGDKTYPIIRDKVSDILVVNDVEIIKAMKIIATYLKLVVEPSGAVTLASVLKNNSIFRGKNVGVIISGGNVDLKKFAELIVN